VDGIREQPTPSTALAAEDREFTRPSTGVNPVNCRDFFKKMKALGLRRGQSES